MKKGKGDACIAAVPSYVSRISEDVKSNPPRALSSDEVTLTLDGADDADEKDGGDDGNVTKGKGNET